MIIRCLYGVTVTRNGGGISASSSDPLGDDIFGTAGMLDSQLVFYIMIFANFVLLPRSLLLYESNPITKGTYYFCTNVTTSKEEFGKIVCIFVNSVDKILREFGVP